MSLNCASRWSGGLKFVLLLATGCATCPTAEVQEQFGESLVCIGEQPAALAYPPIRGKPLVVRNSYLPEPGAIRYEAGRDFSIDYAAGTLRRTPHSRIPDFRTNMLYGQREFDHTKFPGVGNAGFFVFVDYAFRSTTPWLVQSSQAQFLRSTQAKLKSGQALTIFAFGDSITAGGDASRPELIFWERWAKDLQRKYPHARITAINGATGGDSTVQGLRRLKEKVLDQRPDLVLVGFGMNDHNVNGVPVPQFEKNLEQIVDRIRDETGAEVILISAFPPNPEWKFGTHHMQDYARATADVATRRHCAYADVFGHWQALTASKQPEDLLGNNINHPNDFGHGIYYRVLQRVGL